MIYYYIGFCNECGGWTVTTNGLNYRGHGGGLVCDAHYAKHIGSALWFWL